MVDKNNNKPPIKTIKKLIKKAFLLFLMKIIAPMIIITSIAMGTSEKTNMDGIFFNPILFQNSTAKLSLKSLKTVKQT